MNEVIERYLTASAADDTDTLVACFTADATVFDDGRTYEGQAAIRGWRDELSRTLEYTTQVLGEDPPHRVNTEVTGAFPGSPVRLTYDFTLDGDRISRLVIAPTNG